jgi:HEAT repeat protein
MRSLRSQDGIFWRIFPDVRRHERERFLFFAALSTLITAAQTVGLAGSDALFLSNFGPEALPWAFILASVVSVAGALGYAFLVGRVRNDSLYIGVLAGTAVLLLLGVHWMAPSKNWLLVGFFCAFYLTQSVFLTIHFWTFAADYFDTLSSKRVFPYFVVCGSMGGILGGSAGLLASQVAPTESLIVAWAIGLLAAAGVIVRARRSLKRWFPIGNEKDESSAEGMLAALRYLGQSGLARWLSVSVVGMVFALFIMQFIEMGIFTQAFQSPEALAAFFSGYLALSNGVEIIVARGITPALLRRFGIATANLVHPAMILLTFVALAIDPRLHVAVFARASRELFENALANPTRALSYNALPFRFRGRMRAFLEGIVFYAAMSTAGFALLVLEGRLDHRALCGLGLAAAALYAFAKLRVRDEYLKSLVGELRRGRLDLDAVGDNLGKLELARLAAQWQTSLENEATPARGSLDLARLFAKHGLVEPLRRMLTHPHPGVRIACIEALTGVAGSDLSAWLPEALEDPEARVRLAAAQAAGCVPERSQALTARLNDRLDDPDVRVRAEAGLQLAAAGLPTLQSMLSAEDHAAVVAALERLPSELVEEARARLEDEDAPIRASALDALARLSDSVSLTVERLAHELAHPDDRVRRAAARALATGREEGRALLLAKALDDSDRGVREAAAAGLADSGESGVRAAQPWLQSVRRWTAEAALLAVAEARTPASRGLLEQAFRARVSEAWESLLVLQVVPNEGDISTHFLHAALHNALRRQTGLAFRALELLEDPAVVRSAWKALDAASGRTRADALEVLSNLGERAATRQLALLLEDGPVEDKLRSLESSPWVPTELDDAIDWARRSPDRWLQLAAAGHTALPHETSDEVHRMERLLALRRVPLLAPLSLEQLEAIGEFMTEADYLAGEIVVREGEPGNELFVMLEGEVQAVKNYGTPEEIELTRMSPSNVGYFGEHAIFDSAPRSATVVVRHDARLLILDGARFLELIVHSSEIAVEICKVLTQRLRVTEELLRAQRDEAINRSKESL